MDRSHRRTEQTRTKGQFKNHAVAALLLSVATTGTFAESETEPPELVRFSALGTPANVLPLTDEGEATLRSLHEDPNVSNLRVGYGAPNTVLQAAGFSLALSPAPGQTAHFQNMERTDHPNGMVRLYAKADSAGRETSIIIDGKDVLGRVKDDQGNVWLLTPLGGGRTAVYQYDTSQLHVHPPGWDPGRIPEGDPEPPEPDPDRPGERQENGAVIKMDGELRLPLPSSAKNPARPPHLQSAPDDHTSYDIQPVPDAGDAIDVLVLYTQSAKTIVGNVNSFVQLAFESANRHYANSGMVLRLRLAHMQMFHYEESGDIGDDLNALRRASDVHTLRDAHGADLVHLFISGATPGGGGRIYCGVAFYAHRPDWASRAFGTTAVECERIDESTFSHEIGHNLGAAHDPPNLDGRRAPFAYGHGSCNPETKGATIMAYVGINNDCTHEIPYFSSHEVLHRGIRTGDFRTMDNRRVLLATAPTVANHRKFRTRTQPRAHRLPFVSRASNTALQSFIRIINKSNFRSAVSIVAFDDHGQLRGPIRLWMNAHETAHLNSEDLERGNTGKGLSGGLGRGIGDWRLQIFPFYLDIEALAYIRTSDGFVTSMHDVAVETVVGTKRHYTLPFVNPGRNAQQQSWLRLSNPNSSEVDITISGVDDLGRPAPRRVLVTLPAGWARMLSASDIENGASGLVGRLGQGSGKWQLKVSTDLDFPVEVMSLLSLPTGHLTNLSRGPLVSVDEATTPPLPRTDIFLSVTDGCDDGFNFKYKFFEYFDQYSNSPLRSWPLPGFIFVTPGLNVVSSHHTIDCSTGRLVCYGATQLNGIDRWGRGLDGDNHCRHNACCVQCAVDTRFTWNLICGQDQIIEPGLIGRSGDGVVGILPVEK